MTHCATYGSLREAISALLAMRRAGAAGVEWVLFRRGVGSYELRSDPLLVVREDHLADVERCSGVDVGEYILDCAGGDDS